MASEQGLYCRTCQRQTLHHQDGVNHILHFLIAALSCGLWLIVWLFVAQGAHASPWRCGACGTVALICSGCRQVSTVYANICTHCGRTFPPRLLAS